MLEQKGHKEVVVIGGSQAVSQFMQENLIDEVYFDIEPLLFSKGMPIFKDANFEYRLELLGTKMLNKNTIQMHYRVIK